MLDRRIKTSDATPLHLDDPIGPVQTMLSALQDFAVAGHTVAASHHDFSAFAPPSLAARYANANSITRRRFEAILREADTVARVGFSLVVGRGERHDAATIAAARFLGNSIAASLRRLENLLGPQAA